MVGSGGGLDWIETCFCQRARHSVSFRITACRGSRIPLRKPLATVWKEILCAEFEAAWAAAISAAKAVLAIAVPSGSTQRIRTSNSEFTKCRTTGMRLLIRRCRRSISCRKLNTAHPSPVFHLQTRINPKAAQGTNPSRSGSYRENEKATGASDPA